MTKRTYKLLSILLSIVLVTCLSFVLFGGYSFYRERFNPVKHHYRIAMDTALTEELVIGFTRQALIDDGKATDSMTPVQYWPDSQFGDNAEERIFARNSFDPNSGYVLWKIAASGNQWDFSVRIERKGDRIECQVWQPH